MKLDGKRVELHIESGSLYRKKFDGVVPRRYVTILQYEKPNIPKPCKFIITGSHGTGKTSLFASLRGAFSNRANVGFIEEPARRLIAEGYQMNDRINVHGIMAYLDMVQNDCDRASNWDLVICDRGILDLYAYTRVLFGDSLPGPMEDVVRECLRQEISTTTKYLMLPIEFAMEHDDVRPSDYLYQAKIEKNLLGILDAGGANVEMLRGSLETRRAKALDVIASHFSPGSWSPAS